jgi:hypothetical protein
LENVKINGKELEIGLIHVFDKMANSGRSLFYNLKNTIFGAKFANTYRSKNE